MTTARIEMVLPQPTLRARAKTNLAKARGCRTASPLRSLAAASSYRVVGRCMRLSGKITKVRGKGRNLQVEIQLTTPVAQRLYTNAVGTVRIWVMADRRTKVRRAPKVGRTAVVVAPLVATRNLRTVYAVPADAIA